MREPGRLAEVLRSLNPKIWGYDAVEKCKMAADYIDILQALPSQSIVDYVRKEIKICNDERDAHLKELLMEWMAWHQSLYHPAASYQPEQIADIRKLRQGNIIQNKGSGNSYVIIDDIGIAPLAVSTVRVTNPNEWRLIRFKN